MALDSDIRLFCKTVRRKARSDTRWSSRYRTVSLETSLVDARGDFVDRIDPREMDRRRLPGVRVGAESRSSVALASCVEIDERDEASSSAAEPHQLEVEDLFLRGRGGRCLPGISVLSLL